MVDKSLSTAFEALEWIVWYQLSQTGKIEMLF